MSDRLIVTGVFDGSEGASAGRVNVTYKREREDDGQGSGDFELVSPISATDLADLTWYLERYLLAPYAVYAERGAAVEAKLKGWGEALFGALFGRGRPARDAYVRAREGMGAAELVIHSASPEFLSLPWELLKDPERSTPLALDLAGISRRCQVMGQLIAVPKGQELRVLMVISRPSGLSDVDFQMVARPLHERLQAVRGKVRLEVTRPPTLRALEARLEQARSSGEPYHVLHFDGHGVFASGAGAAGMFDMPGDGGAGFLLFEKPDGDGGHAVSAGDFAQLIKRAEVPLVVLNACQSATMGGAGATTGATVATRLLEEGVRSVVAMSHSVYAVAAAEFMAAFYETLFQGRSVLEAMTAGRRQLKQNPERPSPKGDTALQDWIVPVLYARADLRFPELAAAPRSAGLPSLQDALDAMRGGATETKAAGAQAFDGIEAEDGIFVGRGGEFFTLELAARRQRVVLITGPAGTGKTELARGFARWWRDTGGTEKPELVFFHSFEPGLATFGLDGVLIEIGNRVFDSATMAQTTLAERKAAILKLLREHACLLIWDNFESVHSMAEAEAATPALDAAGREDIKAFLNVLSAPGGKSSVLITSRSEEVWLGDLRRIELGGLKPLEAAEYARKLLAAWPIGRARPSQDRQGYEALMTRLDGHPMSMKLILPHLETQTAKALLASLQGQGPLPPGFEGEGRTKGLGASIKYSLDHIEPEIRKLLPVLSLFEGVVDAQILANMSQITEAPAPYAGVSQQKWFAALDRVVELGLLSKLPQSHYRLHPGLGAYLASEWRREAGSTFKAIYPTTNIALVSAFAAFGKWLLLEIETGDAGASFTMIGLNRRTMGSMAKAALAAENHSEALLILAPLFKYLVLHKLNNEIVHWTDTVTEMLDYSGEVYPNLGATYLLSHFVREASEILSSSPGYSSEREAKKEAMRRRLEETPASEDRDIYLASTYFELGVAAADECDFANAYDWFCKSLVLFEGLGSQEGISLARFKLGNTAEQRGDLDEARNWYEKSLALDLGRGNQPGVSRIYYRFGTLALLKNELIDAVDWTFKSLKIRDKLGDQAGIAECYEQLGSALLASGATEMAEDWYLSSLAIIEVLGEAGPKASIYGRLGILAEAKGNGNEAISWTIRSILFYGGFGNARTGQARLRLSLLTMNHGVSVLELEYERITGGPMPKRVQEALPKIGTFDVN